METFQEKINNNSDVIKSAASDINEIILRVYGDLGGVNEDLTPQINSLLADQVLKKYKEEFKVNDSRFTLRAIPRCKGLYRVLDYNLVFKPMVTRKGEYLCIGGYDSQMVTTIPLTEGQKEICRKYNIEMI